ncbi:hypothetical protein, partial [Pseudomonas lopnurensis]|uniref:hypothetical protein n=1 Tax=Pseudomonas lopnurensis TaxID=1477517 RepID=UPI0028B012CA
CKLQAASCKLQASVGWMSLFTSTVAPLVGSMKRAPNYELEAGSWKLEAGSWKLEAGSQRADRHQSFVKRFPLSSSSFRLPASGCFSRFYLRLVAARKTTV